MSWFDSITSVVSDVFTGGSGDSLFSGFAGKALNAGVDAFSAVQTANANKKAAKTVAQGYEAQAAAIREGNDQAQRRYEELQSETKPGITYLREVTESDPYSLTPGQKQKLDDVRSASINSLNQSGLRGSGRAVTAAVRNVESDFVGDSINSNLTRSQQAAGQLANDYSSASINSANASLNTGARVGSLGTGAQEAEAGADLANSSLKGEAIGELQSLFKQEEKEGRKSKFGWE